MCHRNHIYRNNISVVAVAAERLSKPNLNTHKNILLNNENKNIINIYHDKYV